MVTRPGKPTKNDGKIHHFNGKIHYFDWAIFNSELLNYQRVFVQWEFKDPKLEVPTIYFWPIF
jgi:hypothetical protein